ncbi:MAG TPA: periplasmic heavy metal sensor [Caulobacteraceae bacterium]|jgi:uncharacterized membrane protein|nr:periplasmic heavy metal sensor [Caulobacteraceae bacterium]
MRRPWLVIGLVVSLALNLFLIGAAAGIIALGSRLAKDGARPAAALFWATQDLPEPQRRDMRLMLRATRATVLADTNRSLALRGQAWAALADPTPDLAAIKDKLSQSRQIDIAVRTTVEEKIVDYAAQLSPANRALFSAGMRRGLRPAAQTQAAPQAEQPPPTNQPARP